MKRGMLLLVFLVSVSFVYGADCEIIPRADSCTYGYSTMQFLGLNGEVNSHVCVGDVGDACPSEYGYKMCCPNILANNGGIGTTYLSLSSQTNAHTEITSESNYDNYDPGSGRYYYLALDFYDSAFMAMWRLGYGNNPMLNNDCYYDTSSCESGDVCVIALSEDTNAHVADCDYSSDYPRLLCCPEAEEEPETHLECVGGSCQVVGGAGADECNFVGEECGGEPIDPYLEIDEISSASGLCSGEFIFDTGEHSLDIHVREFDEDLNPSDSQGAEVILYLSIDGGEGIDLGHARDTLSSGYIETVESLSFSGGLGNYEIYATATKSGFDGDIDGSPVCFFRIVDDGDGVYMKCVADGVCEEVVGDYQDECNSGPQCDEGESEDPDPVDGLIFHKPGECICDPDHDQSEGPGSCSDGIGDRRIEIWQILDGVPGQVPGGEGYGWFWNDCFLIVEDIPFISISSFVVLAIILMLFYGETFKRKEHLKNLKER